MLNFFSVLFQFIHSVVTQCNLFCARIDMKAGKGQVFSLVGRHASLSRAMKNFHFGFLLGIAISLNTLCTITTVICEKIHKTLKCTEAVQSYFSFGRGGGGG